MKRLFAAVVVAGVAFFAFAPSASAHPLGNFTVNHYHGLTLSPRGLSDFAVVDTAEIPTSQAFDIVDADNNGVASVSERAAYATQECAGLIADLVASVNNTPVTLAVGKMSFEYRAGQAGLRVSRLVCSLTAAADLSNGATFKFSDDFEGSRVGWREITAKASGAVHLDNSPVPAKSITNALAKYPNDLLSSPLNVRKATIVVKQGAGASTIADSIRKPGSADPFSRAMNRVNNSFNSLVGRDRLTFNVGLLAIALAILLGASHAVLPGHGKTVMAAYIAGRQGSIKDAFVVGATVTATHTTGVIVLGLALTASSSLAGESVLRWLGVVSGLLIAALGASLLRNALQHRTPAHSHGFGGHTHAHPEPHAHAHDEHGHDDHGHSHGDHAHPHDEVVAPRDRVLTRRGLVAMGVAGGLVPSPSALVVLLAAIALGRTIFGVALVLFYGIGMAGTLTATGLILVSLRDKYEGRMAERWSRRFATKWTSVIPYTTASIVVLVGVLLATRSLLGAV